MARPAKLLVGLDVGSGSSKASVFTLSGELVRTSSRGYSPTTPRPGVAEYDPREVQDCAVSALADAVAGLPVGAVAAIAVSAMMSGAVAIDKHGSPVGPYTTTLDTRFSSDLDWVLSVGGDAIRLANGSGQPTLAPKILWMDRDPDIGPHAAKYVLAGSLVASHLAGLDADHHFVDETYLWTTGLADVARREWSPELCALLGIDRERLPRIVRSAEVIGGLSESVAQRTALQSGIPIVAGCGDQPAGFVGSGAAIAGVGADCAGTYSVVAGVTSHFAVRSESDAPDVVPVASGSGFNLQSMVNGGGLTRQWAERLFGIGDVEDELMRAAPGARGVRFSPHLGGQAYPARPESRGGWTGLNWAHTPLDLYQAVLEGISLDNARAFVRMKGLYPDVELNTVSVFGGGAKSAAWNQMKANVAGLVYESLGDFPVASLGVAMIAGQGVNLINDATARCDEIRRVEAVFRPDDEMHERYLALADDYEVMVSGLASLDARR